MRVALICVLGYGLWMSCLNFVQSVVQSRSQRGLGAPRLPAKKKEKMIENKKEIKKRKEKKKESEGVRMGRGDTSSVKIGVSAI